MTVTYQKLKNGDWGLRSTEPISAGQHVTVHKKDGSTGTATVGKVLFSGDVTIATIAEGSGGRQRNGGGGGVCAECGRGGALVQDSEDGLMKHYRCCDIPP